MVAETNSDVGVFDPRFLSGIRDEERRILELTGYFQSITVGVAPIVVVIASVATFSAHMLLGYDLTAAQVPGTANRLASLQFILYLLALQQAAANRLVYFNIYIVFKPLWI